MSESVKNYTLSAYDFEMPAELIAQTPIHDRTQSRMLVLDRQKQDFYECVFADLPDILPEKSLLVRNRTRVINARFTARKTTGADIEVFLLKRTGEGRWNALIRPGKRVKPGTELILNGGLSVIAGEDCGDGVRKLHTPDEFNSDYIKRFGEIPLPPYINSSLKDPERYQTVFSEGEGSVAAPTAGLHFTPGMFDRLRSDGVKICDIELCIGLGTFRPLKKEHLKDNRLHTEEYSISETVTESINQHRKNDGKVFCVGTTSVRALESNADSDGFIRTGCFSTDIFIYPGYKWKITDLMLTNFHLPKSSLIVMIAAFAGYDLVMEAYRYAVKKRFRFFSLGDCMLII